MKMKNLHFRLAALLAALSPAVADKNTVFSIEADLSYDQNGKLLNHHLFYPADNPNCPAASFEAPYVYVSRALSGFALQQVFPSYRPGSGACPVACAERGADRSVAHAVMPHKRNPDSTDNFATWFNQTCFRVEVCLMNYHSKETPLMIYWVAPGQKKFILELKYGERNTIHIICYLGHQFQAEDGKTGELVESFTVEYALSRAIGESPPSGDPKAHNFDKEIEDTLRHEWTKHKRVHRSFSPLGFKKARLPEDVFASMGAFYYNNRHNDVREEWNGKGVSVNYWWETYGYYIQVPWPTKERWQIRLKELVEEWAGEEIEQTDMYGLRKDVEGARLLTHVDRETYAVVSLIVNIEQGNLTEPWPVEVNDHADSLHEVIMEPGDIVFYESAKALHGRNRPLSGPNAYYVNLFTHYIPIADSKWMDMLDSELFSQVLTDVGMRE